jgi:hypothetical protein
MMERQLEPLYQQVLEHHLKLLVGGSWWDMSVDGVLVFTDPGRPLICS